MPDRCQKASAIDLAAFLTEPQSSEWEEFQQHLLQCEACMAEVQRWTKLERLLRGMGKKSAATHPAEERLVQFQKSPQSLGPEDRHAIQQHLSVCPVCREGLSQLGSFDFSRIQRWVDEAQPAQGKAEEKLGAVSRVIFQLAHKGFELVAQHLTLPLLDVQEVLVPLPTYRRVVEPPSPVHFRITTNQAVIDATVAQDEDRIALTLTFLGAGQEVLAGQQVFLRRQGRAVFAAQTDSAGVWRTPRLRPGTYEVACPGIETTFELEFRS